MNINWINTPDWESATKYWEAFWHGELLDRPPVLMSVPNPDYEAPSLEPPNDEVRWCDPEFIIKSNEAGAMGRICLGEAIPASRALMCAWLPVYGGEVTFRPDTIWIHPTLTDWNDAPDWERDWDDDGWRKLKRIYAEVCRGAEGRYSVGLPPLLVPNDLLPLLRGSEDFLLDLVERPRLVRETLGVMQANFVRMWNELDAMREPSSGYGNWWPIWCPERLRIIQSDVSCMISSEMFESFIVPEIQALGEDVDHLFYHLDGPDAIRHLEMICSVPKIKAIQWVPGAGNPGHGSCWMDLFKKVQSLGKAIWVHSGLDQLETYFQELDPRLLLLSAGASSVEDAQEVKRKLVEYTSRYRRS